MICFMSMLGKYGADGHFSAHPRRTVLLRAALPLRPVSWKPAAFGALRITFAVFQAEEASRSSAEAATAEKRSGI